MAEVAKFNVIVNDLDTEVENAFKQRMKRGLEMDEEGSSFINIMNSYILWKYRNDWKEIE